MSNSCYQLSNGNTVAAPIYEQVMSQIAHLREQNLHTELLLLLLKLKAEAEHHHTSLEEMLKVLQPEEFWSATGQLTRDDYLEVILDAIGVACSCTPVVQSLPQIQSDCEQNPSQSARFGD